MLKLSVQAIQDLARRIIANKPEGINYTVLVKEICQQSPETPQNTVRGAVYKLQQLFPKEISKPDRGFFKPAGKDAVDVEAVEAGSTVTVQVTPSGIKIQETDFYEPFAEWLKDLDEVTVAVSLGGAGLRSKWGTPDVVGTYKPLAGHLIKFPIEIVAAEIKIDPQASIVAFGQAVAYRLFSTKTYIVMPRTLSEEDLGRLESLCMLFGAGLVLFDLNKDAPEFTIRMRAQRFSPDMFYVNEFAEQLKRHNAKRFQELFG